MCIDYCLDWREAWPEEAFSEELREATNSSNFLPRLHKKYNWTKYPKKKIKNKPNGVRECELWNSAIEQREHKNILDPIR